MEIRPSSQDANIGVRPSVTRSTASSSTDNPRMELEERERDNPSVVDKKRNKSSLRLRQSLVELKFCQKLKTYPDHSMRPTGSKKMRRSKMSTPFRAVQNQ